MREGRSPYLHLSNGQNFSLGAKLKEKKKTRIFLVRPQFPSPLSLSHATWVQARPSASSWWRLSLRRLLVSWTLSSPSQTQRPCSSLVACLCQHWPFSFHFWQRRLWTLSCCWSGLYSLLAVFSEFMSTQSQTSDKLSMFLKRIIQCTMTLLDRHYCNYWWKVIKYISLSTVLNYKKQFDLALSQTLMKNVHYINWTVMTNMEILQWI